MQRRTASRAAARSTPRLLESVVRLTQAHARLMMRPVARADDAVQAIALLRAADAAAGTVPLAGAFVPLSLGDDFSDDPDGVAEAAHAALCAELDAALGPAWRQDAEVPQLPPLLRIECGSTAPWDEAVPTDGFIRSDDDDSGGWAGWDAVEPLAKRPRDNDK